MITMIGRNEPRMLTQRLLLSETVTATPLFFMEV